MEARERRFSGAAGQTVLVVPAVLLVCVPVLALAYAYATLYSPIAGWVSGFLVVAFGLSLGAIVGKAGLVGRCRNPALLRALGAFAGVAGLYVAWGWFEFGLAQQSAEPVDLGILEILANPAGMWAIVEALAESGWYELGGVRIMGTALWVSWAFEAAVVVGFATWIAGKALDEQVYCERCNRWCEPDPEPRKLAVPIGHARPRVRAGDIEAILQLARETPDENDHLILDLRCCTRCRESGSMRLRRAALVTDDEESRKFLEGFFQFFLRFFGPSVRKDRSGRFVEVLLDYMPLQASELERLRAQPRPERP